MSAETIHWLLYPVLQLLVTLIPLNIWVPVTVMFAPAWFYFVRPEGRWRRLANFLLVAGATYCLLNVSLWVSHELEWRAYHLCEENSIHRYDSPEMFEECSPLLSESGADYVFFFFLGWIPALIYTGFWAIALRVWFWWRRKNSYQWE